MNTIAPRFFLPGEIPKHISCRTMLYFISILNSIILFHFISRKVFCRMVFNSMSEILEEFVLSVQIILLTANPYSFFLLPYKCFQHS